MARFSACLPDGYVLRPASQKDIWSIRKLVLLSWLDPTQLRTQQFWVIEGEGKIIACGQLRNFEGAQELGSLVVDPAWRDRGLGTYLVKQLIQRATQPLYLECLGKKLASFYTHLGFVPVPWKNLPPSLKQKFGLSTLAAKTFRLPLTIMHYQK